MSVEDRLRKLEEAASALHTGPVCHCGGGEVTCDTHGRTVCHNCGCRLPEGARIAIADGLVPARPDGQPHYVDGFDTILPPETGREFDENYTD